MLINYSTLTYDIYAFLVYSRVTDATFRANYFTHQKIIIFHEVAIRTNYLKYSNQRSVTNQVKL